MSTSPDSSHDLSRRQALASAGALAAAAALGVTAPALAAAAQPRPDTEVDLDKLEKVIVNDRIHQGICGCGLRLPIEKKCQLLVKLGFKSIDFTGPNDWPTLKKYGLVASLCAGGAGNIANGWNRKENHERFIVEIKKNIDLASDAGWPTVITMSGNRHKDASDKEGISDEEGLKNCVEGLKQVAGYAEQKKVTIVVELLNSKVDHKDYMADHSAWGAAMCKAIGSPNVKLLFDIYHMAIQEGDLIRNIRAYKDYIGHYHTAGNPGRNELDENQETYYPAVMRAIVATGYKGYVSHEYNPKGDPIRALIQAAKVCDV